MKKITLILVAVIFGWTFQSVSAQTSDTTNHVEVKKKVKTRRKGRNTSVKTVIKGSGSTDAVNGTTSVAVTGKPTPAPEKHIDTPPQTNTVYVPVQTPAPAPVIIQAPSVEPKPTPMSTSVTTTTESRQVPVTKTTSTHVVHTTHTTGTHAVVKKVYKKPMPAAATVKTTTTTTTTKPTDN